MRTALLLTVALLCFAFSVLGDEINCDNCGKRIAGAYYRSPDGKSYCDSCWRDGTICVQCGSLTRSPVLVDDKPFCPRCFSGLERCSLCSTPIIGSYTRYPALNLLVCSKCEQEKPRCTRCSIPTNSPIEINGMRLCKRCVTEVENCHSCGSPLLTDYSYYEGNQNFKYCFECTKRYVRCSNCGAPSGQFGTRLDDGRYLCPECRKISLFDHALINPIRNKVVIFVSAIMNMPIKHEIEFGFKDKGFLKNKAKGIHGDLNGLFYRKGDDYYIYVLYGLREKDFISVFAHELSHAWQAENCPDDLLLEDQEGFCQWVAFKALIHFGYPEFAELLKEGDSVYSRGLKKMARLEAKSGATGVFKYMKGKEPGTL